MCTALTAETIEMLEETGWKPWSSSWHINTAEARAEWIDAWHFMLNIANKLGMDEEMIFDMYGTKAAVNMARIEGGYDGVSTKCPGCRRALDDPATSCGKLREPNVYWCAMEMREVSMLGR
jgi:dimeric dUTPase (all-alpha-NTP-PPase superfamily)